MNQNGQTTPWLPLALAIISLIGSLYVNVTRNDRDNAQRVTALEAKQTDTTARLDRIENKVDKLGDDMSRLVGWALGNPVTGKKGE